MCIVQYLKERLSVSTNVSRGTIATNVGRNSGIVAIENHRPGRAKIEPEMRRAMEIEKRGNL
jgi:hypothetical protein